MNTIRNSRAFYYQETEKTRMQRVTSKLKAFNNKM